MECYSQEEIIDIKNENLKVELEDEEKIKLLELAENFDLEYKDGTICPMNISKDCRTRTTTIFGRTYGWDSLFGCNPSMDNYFYVLSAQNGGNVSEVSNVFFYKSIVDQVLRIFHKL